MFENLPPLHRPTHDADTPRRRALNALGTVLGTLPAPWRVLRDASPSGEGAGLGVRFMALHPNFGIALVDLAPARPKAALAPLRALLTRGNGAIFTTREPPIASVLLARDELPLAAARVEASLAELPPSGIANPTWPEIAIALVTASYPHMMPTDGDRRAIAASAYASPPNPTQRAPEAPAEAPPPRREAARTAPASAAAAAPPAATRESAAPAARPAAAPPSPAPETPERAAASVSPGMPPIDLPRIEVPQLDPHRPDRGALEVPPAAIEIPVATAPAPEAPPASGGADAANEDEQPTDAPKPETSETLPPEARQAARRRRAASPRNSRSRRPEAKPSAELPQIEIPRPDLNGGGEAWLSPEHAASAEPRLDVPWIDVPQPPSQPIPEGVEAQSMSGEAPPHPRFERSRDETPAGASEGLGQTGSAEPRPPRLRLVAERDPVGPWPDNRRSTNGRKRSRPVLWVVGGTLSVIIAAVVAYPHLAGEPVDVTQMTQASPAPSAPASGSQQDASNASPAPEAVPQQAENAPVKAAPAPQPSPSPPTETADAKPVAPQHAEQSNPAAAPHAATILPPVATLPETLPEESIAAAKPPAAPAKQATQPTREAAATPAPKPATEAKAKPEHAPKLAKTRRAAPEVTREAEAEIAPKPAPKGGVPPKASGPAIASAAIHPRDDNPGQDTPSNQTDKSDASTVMIGGTSYVAGREPHFLGSLPLPAELASAPVPVSVTPPADDAPPATSDMPPAGPLPPSTDFAITPHGIMTPSGVVTPFGK